MFTLKIIINKYYKKSVRNNDRYIYIYIYVYMYICYAYVHITMYNINHYIHRN